MMPNIFVSFDDQEFCIETYMYRKYIQCSFKYLEQYSFLPLDCGLA